MSCQIRFVNSLEYYQARGFKRLDPQGIELVIVDNPSFRLVLSRQGGQLLECLRKCDQRELLWLSPLNTFAKGTAIRGGIPICFPWFGVKQSNPQAAKHGFVRNRDWRIGSIVSDGSSIELELEIAQSDNPGNPADYPYSFVLQQRIQLSEDGLRCELAMLNNSRSAVNISWAWHSYFNVNASETRVEGLSEQHYLDNCDSLQSKLQRGEIEFRAEVDRVYQPGAGSTQYIRTGDRQIIVASDAPSCIIWNPGELARANMADVAQGFSDFICLERGAAFDQSLTLAAGENYKAKMTIVF